MKSLTRLFILWVACTAIAAGAMTPTGSEGVALDLTPDEALSGATLTVGQSYPMTLGITGAAETEYGVTTTSEGGVGGCATPAGTVTTDADGSASWLCDFTAGADPTTGALTFTLTQADAEIGYLRALFTLTPPVEVTPVVEDPVGDDPADDASEEASSDNHGGCVSYWAHRSKQEGLEGSARGHFVSWIAHSDCTTSTREDEEFVTAFEQALADQNASATAETTDGGHGHGHGKDKNGSDE